jgi:choloylglycine hydrolase
MTILTSWRAACATSLAALMAATAGPASACTALMITDVNGVAYSGKTMEYSEPIPLAMVYMPAGTKVISLSPDGSDGMTFTTKYPILGGAAPAAMQPGLHQAMMVEAANDQGLSVSTNELPETVSPTDVGTDKSKQLAGTDLSNWVLGNFATVAEAKAALTSGDVKIWLPKLDFVGGVLPEHYIFFDKTGDGIVVEFTGGTMNVYDNPVGVATNAPIFPWHLANLNNYAGLTNVDRNEGQFGKLKVTAPDSGNALAGLPSSQISAGRFVKAAYYTTYTRKAKNPDEAVTTLAHILNNFDRPYDLSADPAGTGGDGTKIWSTSTEVTVFTWMNDKSRNRYYLRTIDAVNFTEFDIDKLAVLKKPVSVDFTKIVNQPDGTQMLLDAAGN